ncbi:hypothetical protein [Desulfosporosinus shakirovi]|uniref:hypothetical protein n=1 Tax=Desulfosporosinus shakirovi TaxID=2885154 RepID=UPI001E4D66D2|nr:hypothetical protein [Desulfosporosinus sp. SRJS8]MCB8818763.1 hypothetical protein [Desulfosporosinus sp. SRJS8]
MSNEMIEFITKSSLYSSMKIRDPEIKQLLQIYDKESRFELFCAECRDKKVFIYDCGLNNVKATNLKNKISSVGLLTSMSYQEDRPLDEMDHLYLRFNCSLDESHKLEYFFAVKGDSIIKVGQYPSSADIDLPQASRYSSILGKQYYSELKRSIGLHSHGVGIGSFVYLRRIIEKLVYDTFKEAEVAGALTEQQFEYQDNVRHRNGMEEKIKLLKGFLPDLITDHPKIYGVVSKGIHELTEEECLEYFPVLKDGIVMILDDIVAKKEKERAAAEYKKSLNGILSKMK